MNNILINELKWDTEYFGVKSAKVVLQSMITKDDLNRMMHEVQKYEFITIVNNNNNAQNNFILGKYSTAFLVDVNMQFIKQIQTRQDSDNTRIFFGRNLSECEELQKIALDSFQYSRFFNDPFLNKERSKEIYKTWVKNAFCDEKKTFCCYKIDNEVLGFILFSSYYAESKIVIELIAVSNNKAQSGIGKSLIRSLEDWASNGGYKEIQVGTQSDNLKALNFYYSCGYKLIGCNAVYHLWI